VKLVDDILLVGELGIAVSEVNSLRDAHVELAARRATRGGPGPRSPAGWQKRPMPGYHTSFGAPALEQTKSGRG
ncbi:MAG: hypothetical protein ACRDUV_10060, partial [Pseudonocardiaceae bacterium]